MFCSLVLVNISASLQASDVGIMIDNEVNHGISLSKGASNYSILHSDCENELSEEDPYVIQPGAKENSVFMFSVLPKFFTDKKGKDGLLLKIDGKPFATIYLDKQEGMVLFEPVVLYSGESDYKIEKIVPERGKVFVFKVQKKA
ncbi:MAG: hypothetical protein ACTSXG_04230 [Alphaproteobacteria bacterium]